MEEEGDDSKVDQEKEEHRATHDAVELKWPCLC